MKTIRTNCFETNSSSTHSFTIDTSYNTGKEFSARGKEITAGEFGWEWRKFNDFETKASYFWTLCYDDVSEYVKTYFSDLSTHMKRLAKKHGFTLVQPASNSYCYVDHGFEHYEKFVKNHPKLNTDEGLWEFLTSPAFWITLGNDNSVMPCNARLTPNQIANATRFIVLDAVPDERWAIMKGTDVKSLAEHIVHAYYDKFSYEARRDLGWAKIIDNSDGVITVSFEEYDYKTQQYISKGEEKLTYKIITR